ncbi:hypothetical protein QEZ54_08480 [Catellatospora sp. KI3]|uniref:hypothetical protein n=1 Tax=Catellatospora sp. KI3 TaxID=3041620 RepID=UPI0024831477|nr:hypothetical protein [Catellatospora sp. KI3]MDI1460997.1 hypothetical protein [Catellatospora sp. KI3]
MADMLCCAADVTHRHPGAHTVLVCVSDRTGYGPRLLNAVERQLAAVGVAACVTDSMCSRHLLRRGDWAAAVHTADLDLDAARRHAVAAGKSTYWWYRLNAYGTPPLPLALLRDGTPQQIAEHPRSQWLRWVGLGLGTVAAELFGIGLMCLQAGPTVFAQYAAATTVFGHALITCDGELLRSGGSVPARDTLGRRLTYAGAAEAYLRGLRDAVVCVVHVDLPAAV